MREWLKRAVLKTAVPERVSGVRIPLPPPLCDWCIHGAQEHSYFPPIPSLPTVDPLSPTTGDGASWPQSVSSGLYLQRIPLDAPGLTFVTFLWVGESIIR